MHSDPFVKLVRAIAWRTLRMSDILILAAGPVDGHVCVPTGFRFITVDRCTPEGLKLVRKAMTSAQEPDVAEARLREGHRFYGWQDHAGIQSFGWTCASGRQIGRLHMLEKQGRLYCYNFFTAPRYRGQGLYPSLLASIRRSQASNGSSEFLIDVSTKNLASRRGIDKAGFELAACTRVWTVFNSVAWRGSSQRFPCPALADGDIWYE